MRMPNSATFDELPRYWRSEIMKLRNEGRNLRQERNGLRAELEALRAELGR